MTTTHPQREDLKAFLLWEEGQSKGSVKQGKASQGEGKAMPCNVPPGHTFNRGSSQVPSSPFSPFVEGSILCLLGELDRGHKGEASSRGLRGG